MKARDIMTRNVITVTPRTSVKDAIALLTEHAITSLPVLDEDGDVVGIVSELDLLRGRLPHDPTATLSRRSDGPDPARFIADVMHAPVICISQEADSADVAKLLIDNNVRAVPIIDGPDLVGIVSRRDVLQTLVRDDAAIAAAVREGLEEYSETVAHGDTPAIAGASDSSRWKVTVLDGVVTVRGHFDSEHQADGVATLVRTVPGVARTHVKRTWR